jgi:hypothetical protein
MAINVYTPTCHLLCHDDVIGSRRISYILYLTDPDLPWKAEWGGALRLYPTQALKTEDGAEMLVPSADFSVSIPPAFNQLSFFSIQPGKSFHDVEEVYARKEGDDASDGGRVRMAISGWFHIPQDGEEGYEEGIEEKLAERSSLNQLQQSKADVFDLPQSQWKDVEDAPERDEDETPFTDDELDWLLRFLNPTYLTPDTVEALRESFEENSAATLAEFLHPKFADALRKYLEPLDDASSSGVTGLGGAEKIAGVARPPHKHRFLYRQPTLTATEEPSDTPLDQLVEHLLPSPLFARWLSLITGLSFTRADFLARRFRRGMDYTLATSYDEPQPQLELCLGITPSSGWGEDDANDEEESEDEIPARGPTNNRNGKISIPKTEGAQSSDPCLEPVGGYEMYMAGDEEDEDGDSHNGIEIPTGAASHTGAGQRKRTKADPAVYRSSGDDEEDDVLFNNPAGWNKLTIVLRDRGVMKFVKYVSESAKGDRWDMTASFSVMEEIEDEDED